MKNNFLSFVGIRAGGRHMNVTEITRKSPRNHPEITRFGKVITMILFLFTFAIGNVWGADPTPGEANSAYLDISKYSTITTAGWSVSNLTNLYAYDSSKGILRVSVYGSVSASGTQKWVSGSIGNTSRTWDATGNFAGSAAYMTSSSKCAQLGSSKNATYKVTNCTKIEALYKTGGSSRKIYLKVYEQNADGSDKSTPVEAGTDEWSGSNAVHSLEVSDLNPSKVYKVVATNDGTGNSDFYEMAFTTSTSSGPSISSFSPATGASVGASQEITITGSTGSTVYYLWATSEPASAAAVVSADHHGTAGAASATTTVESGKTLYAVAVKDATNSTVASATYTIDATAPTLSSSTPANSATNVATSGNIKLTFNENVTVNDASKFSISPSAGVTLSTPTVSGAVVTIPYSGLSEGTEYTFSTAAGAVKDAAGNTSAALSDIVFTTGRCAVTSCGNASLTYAINASTDVTNTAANLLVAASTVASNTTALGISTTAALSTISISDSDNKGKAAAATNSCFAEKQTMSSKIGMYNGSSYSSSNYLQFTFTVKEGYTFTPCDIQFVVQPVSNAGYFRWEVTDGTTSYGYGTGSAPVGSGNGATVLTGLSSTSEMSAGTYYIRLYPYYNGANTFRISNDVILRGTTAEAVAPTGYAITKSATNGTIAVTDGSDAITSADEDDVVYIAATPNTGYGFTSWDVYKTSDATTKVSLLTDDDSDNKTRKFTMPAYPVTVGATFTAIDYTVTHSAATNGTYTIKVGTADAVSTNTTANYGQTVVLAATPASGYKFKAWTVMNGETPVAVSSNQFTMPAGNVTVSASFEEVECPTSGTVFSMSGWKNVTNGSDWKDKAQIDVEIEGLTISGGSAHAVSIEASKTCATDGSGDAMTYYMNYNSVGLRCVLDCPLQPGDIITIESASSTTNVYIFTNTNSRTTSVTSTNTSGTTKSYTVVKDDILDGKSDIYVWKASSSGNKEIKSLTITRPEKYDVTYYKNDGSETSTLAEGVSKVAANEFVRSGYQFTGWNTQADGKGTAYAVGADLSSDLELYAQWAQLYAIAKGSPSNGSIEASAANAIAGATVTLTATPSSGYKLKAWDVYKTGDATTKVSVTNNQFTMPAYGVTVSAEFVESVVLYDYSVMEAAGNKSFTGEEVTADQGASKDKTFGTEGNPQLAVTNAGWDSKSNIINSFIKFFGGTSGMSVVIPTGRKATVTIKYGSYSINDKYLLVNEVAQTKPIKPLDNDITTATLGDYMPTVELTNQTGTLVLTASTGNIYIAYVDVTLTGYASYGITYHLNDGAWYGDAGAATYTYGTGIASLADNVTKNGNDFAGWYGNEGLTGDEITSIADNVTGDKELWAKWEPKSYTLTWDWDGGDCSATAGEDYTAGGSVAYGAAITYPEASTMSKADAAFAGWSTSAATMPAEVLTITALWAPEHAITYTETKGATNSNPELYIEGIGIASFEPLADVTNFHFTGWLPASISADATTDQTIVAQWVAAYNVSFNAGEGSGTVPAAFQKWSGATVELPGQGEMVAPEGKIFVGWKANGAGDVLEAGDEYTMTAAAVEFVAQWKAVTLLINYDGENYSLNTTDFHTGVTLQDEIVASGYPTNAKFGNTCSAVTSIDNLNKAIIYHTKTNVTKVTISAYNNYTGGSTGNLYYSVVAEGATSASVTTKSMTKGSATTDYEVNMTGRSTLYIMCGHDIRICQVSVEENGTANKVAPEVGYSVNLNKQRPFLLTGVATSFEGVEYKVASNFKPVNGQVQIGTLTSTYYKFTIPAGQTRQLQLTTSNTSKYVVSKTLGDDTEAKKISGNQNINLTAGTWYINPQGSNVNITNIAFAATPDPIVVEFNSNGGSEVASQALFAGDKVAVPTAPTKSGYRFVGWQKSGVDYDFTTALVAGDAPGFQLDAVWQQVWTVTFDSNGGSNVEEQIVDNGGVATLPDPAPTKAGHSLVRWYKVTGEEGQEETAYNFSTAVTADITLKALWHELQNDPSLGSLKYNGNTIDLSSGVESEDVITYTYELPYNVNYAEGKLVPVAAAGTATVSSITYTSGTKTASFTVTTADGPVVQNYAVVFTNAPKDMLCLIKGDVGESTMTIDASSSYWSGTGENNDVRNSSSVYPVETGLTGWKFNNKGAYLGLTLSGTNTFQEGDIVEAYVTSTISDKLYVFSNKTTSNLSSVLLASSSDNLVQGKNTVTLPETSTNKIYLCRGDDKKDYDGWNPFVAYVAVYRAYPVPVIKSISFNGAAGTIDGTNITATIPYTTNMASLPIEATFMSNDPANTTGDVGGPWVENEGVYTNSYVVTDKDGDTKTYTVTLTRAEVSHDASLTELEVEGYSISFDPEVLSYSIELPYGSVIGDLPDITYTVAVGATAVKTDAAVLPGNTVIEVTAEDEYTIQEYIVRFTVNRTPRIVIYEGVNADAFVTESSSELVTWTSAGSGSIQNSGCTLNGKTYTNNVKIFGGATSSTRYVEFVIPDNYFAKIYLAASSNSDDEVTIYVTKDELSTKDNALVSVVGDRNNPDWGETDYVFPGHYFLNATNSTRLYELSVQLYPIDYTRDLQPGMLSTTCLPKGGVIAGASIFEVAYMDYEADGTTPHKIYFDEVEGGIMEAGMPYVVLLNEGSTGMAVSYTDSENKAAQRKNGLVGYMGSGRALVENEWFIYNNMFYYVSAADAASERIHMGSNRAYLDLTDIPGYHHEPINNAPLPGRRRIAMGNANPAPQVLTGIEDVQGEQVQSTKVLINGELFIIRGDKMYDATGKLVK